MSDRTHQLSQIERALIKLLGPGVDGLKASGEFFNFKFSMAFSSNDTEPSIAKDDISGHIKAAFKKIGSGVVVTIKKSDLEQQVPQRTFNMNADVSFPATSLKKLLQYRPPQTAAK